MRPIQCYEFTGTLRTKRVGIVVSLFIFVAVAQIFYYQRHLDVVYKSPRHKLSKVTTGIFQHNENDNNLRRTTREVYSRALAKTGARESSDHHEKVNTSYGAEEVRAKSSQTSLNARLKLGPEESVNNQRRLQSNNNKTGKKTGPKSRHERKPKTAMRSSTKNRNKFGIFWVPDKLLYLKTLTEINPHPIDIPDKNGHTEKRDLPLWQHTKCDRCLDEKNEEQLIKEHALEVAKIRKHLFRNDMCSGCFKHNFKFLIDGENICRDIKDIDVLILITTTHYNTEGRNVLRNTWLTYANYSTKLRYVFLLGETKDKNLSADVRNENEVYGDIVMEDFIDSYKNLTYKTLMGLKWATSMCSQAKYIMKTDDDMYVNVPALIDLLRSKNMQFLLENAAVGNCWKGTPIRDPNSKYYASLEDYPHFYYPPFCTGGGYVLSMRSARKIYEVSQNVPFFHLEDVYIGMCLQQIGLTTHNQQGFSIGIDQSGFSGCYVKRDTVISAHAQNLKTIQRIWNSTCANSRLTRNDRERVVFDRRKPFDSNRLHKNVKSLSHAKVFNFQPHL